MVLLRFLSPVGKYSKQFILSNEILLNNMVRISAQNISSLALTKNLTLLSNEKKSVKVINLKLDKEQNRPLVVMLSWLMAKRKHIYKYADIYLNMGYDVLNVSVSPWQLLWPTKGTQMVAQDILKFLDGNFHYTPLLLHGFSVGGYVWGEVMVKMVAEKDRYDHIKDRVIGQIWDSAADISEIPIGLPLAVFPRNSVLQAALKQYILYHMKTFHKVATCHYIRASQIFFTNVIRKPALIFVSKTDPVGSLSSNLRLKETWENMGIQVNWKCFEKSPHVGHFRAHPKEYLMEINNFLESINQEQSLMKKQIQAKL